MFEASDVAGLRRVPVVLVSCPPRYPNRVWSAEARADEDIVGVLFESHGVRGQWCKSSASGLVLRFEIAWGAYLEPRQIQVTASLGSGALSHSLWLTTEGPPHITPGPSATTTGRLERIASVEGRPSIELWALFLARSDVKFGRNRLWNVRPALREQLPTRLARWLSAGRCGDLPLPE